MPMYSTADLSPVRIYPALYLYVYGICYLKLCVNCIKLGKRARLSTKGETMGIFPEHFGGKSG
jgi:hypothetical protein